MFLQEWEPVIIIRPVITIHFPDCIVALEIPLVVIILLMGLIQQMDLLSLTLPEVIIPCLVMVQVINSPQVILTLSWVLIRELPTLPVSKILLLGAGQDI